MTLHPPGRSRPVGNPGPSEATAGPPGRRTGGEAGVPLERPTPVVLAADDDPRVLDMLGKSLRHLGVPAHLAPDGAGAVELFRRHGAAITLVLLDVRMPGLDGPGALAALRAIDPGVHCWFMTGDPTPYTVPDLLSRGAAGVLGKPYTLPALRAVVNGSVRLAPT